MRIRQSFAAGSFYPASKEELLKLLDLLFSGIKKEQRFHAAIMPHAGYVFSGRVAAEAAAKLKPKKTFVIFGTDHYGNSRGRITVAVEDFWQTPLGRVKISDALRQRFVEAGARTGEMPHEHSIEVILPFLQYVFGSDFGVLPVLIPPISITELEEFASFLSELPLSSIGFIASTDMSHEQFLPVEIVKDRDRRAIELIKALNYEALLEYAYEGYTMCGVFGVALLLALARKKGLKPYPLAYATSYDVTGDTSYIVGYFSCGFGEENG